MEDESVSLKCADCGTLLKTVDEAEEHVEITRHTNFSESAEPILNLVCSTCARSCRSKTESDLHTKRSGHSDFVDKTLDADDDLLENLALLRYPGAWALQALISDAEQQAEIRRELGLPPEGPTPAKPSAPVEEKKSRFPFWPFRPATKAEQMRECLRLLKQNHKDDDAKVGTAFETLYTIVRNVAMKPDEEKFRKIRLGNVNFQNRVGKLEEGIDFLELCEFEKVEGVEFLFLPRDKVDMEVLGTAGIELENAVNQPFFGFF